MWLLQRKNRPSTLSWPIVRRFGAFSTTTRVDRFIRRVYGWPRRSPRCGSRSNETWTQKKGVRRKATRPLGRLHRQGLSSVESEQDVLGNRSRRSKKLQTRWTRKKGISARRQAEFQKLIDRFVDVGDPFHEHMAKVMISFQPGLFVGGDEVDQVRDNLDLERWFRLPKGHERRIHGHKHAGVRIVQEGATMALALDAHKAHPEQFTVDDLLPYRSARSPECQRQAMDRRKIMEKARSKPKRPNCSPSWNADIWLVLAVFRVVDEKRRTHRGPPCKRSRSTDTTGRFSSAARWPGHLRGPRGRRSRTSARVELDPPLLLHGEVAGQGDDGVGQGDLAAAAGLVLRVVVVVRGVAVADAVGEVLELLAVAARRVGGGQAAQGRRRRDRAGQARAGLDAPACSPRLLDRDARQPRGRRRCPPPCRAGSPSPASTIIVPREPMTISP